MAGRVHGGIEFSLKGQGVQTLRKSILALALANRQDEAAAAIDDEMAIELAASQEIVPVASGRLKRSGRLVPTVVTMTGDKVDFVSRILYGLGPENVLYAVVQHEKLHYQHDEGEAQYLESVMRRVGAVHGGADRAAPGRALREKARMTPRFSIIVPTTGRPTLERALDSLVRQPLVAGRRDDRERRAGLSSRPASCVGVSIGALVSAVSDRRALRLRGTNRRDRGGDGHAPPVPRRRRRVPAGRARTRSARVITPHADAADPGEDDYAERDRRVARRKSSGSATRARRNS